MGSSGKHVEVEALAASEASDPAKARLHSAVPRHLPLRRRDLEGVQSQAAIEFVHLQLLTAFAGEDVDARAARISVGTGAGITHDGSRPAARVPGMPGIREPLSGKVIPVREQKISLSRKDFRGNLAGFRVF